MMPQAGPPRRFDSSMQDTPQNAISTTDTSHAHAAASPIPIPSHPAMPISTPIMHPANLRIYPPPNPPRLQLTRRTPHAHPQTLNYNPLRFTSSLDLRTTTSLASTVLEPSNTAPAMHRVLSTAPESLMRRVL
ncbi:hypothetical protein CC86DRAFT_201636 [Ophiobolus disseminans]|uniref:Uncharacterized protein n=1 Tax=Ophiobolus disseminans TaxID=1469910 RepID=A0A6A7A424_9PLEO|nr:hypothetical protein CC86DRAFT_201636 [Ophiobolus disseminans]